MWTGRAAFSYGRATRSRGRIASCSSRWRALSSLTAGHAGRAVGRPATRCRAVRGGWRRCRGVPAGTRTARGAAPRSRSLNGLGGFTADGREYVITTAQAQVTPAPWVERAGERELRNRGHRERPGLYLGRKRARVPADAMGNDPVTDTGGEAYYLRDEETRDASGRPRRCPRRGQRRLPSAATVSATAYSNTAKTESLRAVGVRGHGAPVKFSVLKVRNDSGQARRLSATGYVEWVLGDRRGENRHARGHRDRTSQRRGLRSQSPTTPSSPAAWLFSTSAATARHCHRRP